jgi:hypothetical protein
MALARGPFFCSNSFMTEIYFLARHTPFWAIPMLVLAGEFGYLFWLKKKRKSALLCVMIALISLSSASFYYWAGGPEKSVKVLKKLRRDME